MLFPGVSDLSAMHVPSTIPCDRFSHRLKAVAYGSRRFYMPQPLKDLNSTRLEE
jgi:hypothetical protein